MVKKNNKSTFYIVAMMLMLISVAKVQASLLVNGDFEDQDNLDVWITTPSTAFFTDPGIVGTSAGILDTLTLPVGFAVMEQTVAVDGNNLSWGNFLQLSALTNLISTGDNASPYYIEIAFTNGSDPDGVGDVDFDNNVVRAFGSFGLEALLTQVIQVPEITLGELTTGVRVALAIGFKEDNDDRTVVLFDNVSLDIVDVNSPSTIAFILLMSAFIFRKRVSFN